MIQYFNSLWPEKMPTVGAIKIGTAVHHAQLNVNFELP